VAWNNNAYFLGGESQDNLTERLDGLFSAAFTVPTITPSSDYAQTGSWSVLYDYTLSNSNQFGRHLNSYGGPSSDELGSVFTNVEWVFSGAWIMNNDITTGKQIPLWQYTNGGNPAGVNITPVVIVGLSSLGTNDRKVRVLDKNGNVVATSTFEIPKTGTTMKEIHVVFDACLTTSTVWVKLYNGATEDVAVDTGLSFSSFFKTSNVDEWISGGKTPSGGAGAKLWGDNVGFRYTKTAADAVHLTGYPRPRVIGGVTAIPMAGQGRTPSTSADHLWGLTTGTSISGSDGGTPIKITTTAAHGLSNGAHVSIRGHTIDTAANG